MNICVVGAGFVGLACSAVFAEFGHKVICIDKDKTKINNLTNGIIQIHESSLPEMINKNILLNNLKFDTDINYGVQESEVVFICVGTPSLVNGDVDLSQYNNVIYDISKSINSYKVIVNKSTVPIGTQKYAQDLIKKHCAEEIILPDIVSNPEFLREGTAIYDMMNPDRIIIGSSNKKATDIMLKLYEPFKAPKLIVSPESSEMIKYASNTFIAAKISFINEVANICEKVGADISSVSEGMGLDKRISPVYLNAGIGYGGACLPKDTAALHRIAESVGYKADLIKSVIDVNTRQREIPLEKLKKIFGCLEGKVISILGLSFKPNTNDMRSAPSIDIINEILKEGGFVRCYDPVSNPEAQKHICNVAFCNDPYAASSGADAVVLVTEWQEFKDLDLNKLKDTMKDFVFIDCRNVFNQQKMNQIGFNYHCIGGSNSSDKAIVY